MIVARLAIMVCVCHHRCGLVVRMVRVLVLVASCIRAGIDVIASHVLVYVVLVNGLPVAVCRQAVLFVR